MSKLKSVSKKFEPVIMDIGGRERQLIFDMNSFAELEKRYGSIELGMAMLQSGDINGVKKMLWLACIHDEVKEFDEEGEPLSYNINPYQVGKWINLGMLEEISTALTLAMTNGMPESKVQKILETEMTTVNGQQVATVVYTEEEKAEMAKNG